MIKDTTFIWPDISLCSCKAKLCPMKLCPSGQYFMIILSWNIVLSMIFCPLSGQYNGHVMDNIS